MNGSLWRSKNLKTYHAPSPSQKNGFSCSAIDGGSEGVKAEAESWKENVEVPWVVQQSQTIVSSSLSWTGLDSAVSNAWIKVSPSFYINQRFQANKEKKTPTYI